jgi:threonine/homoserine/homoserine lactone efflux protein
VELALPLPLRGLILGFTIAMAVGPMSLLTIRRTLAHGRAAGLASGLGIATADGIYAAVAAFGLTAITGFLVSVHVILGVVGGAVIALMGLRTMATRPTSAATDTAKPGLASSFLSILGLTMTNPLTIVLFAGMFAGIGLATGAGFADALVLTVAVWLGSTTWWLVLVSVVAWLRERFSMEAMLWVNRISGAALVAFGILAVISALSG